MSRGAPSIAVSVAVHAAVFAWAMTRVAPPKPPPAREVVRVELAAAPRKAPPPSPAPEPPKPVVRRAPRAKPKAKVAAPAPAPAPIPTPLPPPVEVATPVTPPAPVRVETAPAPPVPPAKIDLFGPIKAAPGRGGVAIAPPSNSGRESVFARLPGEAAGEEAADESTRVAQRIAGATTDANAKTRVEAGLVDPSYAALGRAFLDAWDPDRALPETSAELWAKRRAHNALIGTQLWKEAGSRFAQTGSPMVDGEEPEETEAALARDLSHPLNDTDKQRRDTFRKYMRGKFNEGRSAFVLVEQFPDRVKVSLVRSSGDMDIDRAALEDIERAAKVVQASVPVLTGVKRSLWSLRLQIIIHPPLPIGGFTFDEVLEAPKLELPLGRKLLKRVRLEAVYDDDPRLAPAEGIAGEASNAPSSP